MTRKKKKKDKYSAEKYQNLPTRERLSRGGITIHNNAAKVDEPLRIDKLRNNEIIDEMQHLYGLQILTLWTIANRPFLKTTQFEQRTGSRIVSFEHINLTRMTAEEQLFKTMGYLRKRDHDLICKICFEEMGAIEAGRDMGLPINSITVYVRAAFDALGDALAQMREVKRELERKKEEGVV